MVAISMYRGNLHRLLPDVVRTWPMPRPALSSKKFRRLLRGKLILLSRLTNFAAVASSSVDPTPNSEARPEVSGSERKESAGEVERGGGDGGNRSTEGEDATVEVTDDPMVVEGSVAVDNRSEVEEKAHVLVDNAEAKIKEDDEKGKEKEKEGDVAVNNSTETSKKEDSMSDEGKRRREIEDKLRLLKEKKHGLVQVLKQILNAEEELKRRSSIQETADGIPRGDVEGGELDGTSNHSVDTRHLIRTTSASPSSDSQSKKLSGNVIPHLARTASGVSGSPSRFASSGQQGHLSVSVSGTTYIASSPSPVASGGTSAFRENRIASPWN